MQNLERERKRKRGEAGNDSDGSNGNARDSSGRAAATALQRASARTSPNQKKQDGTRRRSFERQGSFDQGEDLSDALARQNIVKIFCNHKEPDFSRPWAFKRQTASTSSGFVIKLEGREQPFVLTNAHSVDFAATVQVRKYGESLEYDAAVECLGHECDLALLSVTDPEFWDGLEPLRWGKSPDLQDPVLVVGYPIGGDNISVTQGVVSRIDLQQYSLGSLCLLAIQIDAAINAGNSGGPALNRDNECVGVAFQALKDGDAENIGYIIPTEVIFHFLKDYLSTGGYTGFADGGLYWQRLKNKSMRQALGLKDKRSGVLIKKVEKASMSHGIIKPGDILTEIEDHKIDSDGTVAFHKGTRIPFSWVVTNLFVGDQCRMKLVRDGVLTDVEVKLSKFRLIVPSNVENNVKAQYIIVGGFVFVPLSEPFLRSEYGENFECRAPVRLLDAWQHGSCDTADEQVVLLSHVLAHEITSGFEYLSNTIVRKFNNQKPANIKHLARMVRDCTSEEYHFELDLEERAIINAELARATLPKLLEAYSIPELMPAGLLGSPKETEAPKSAPQGEAMTTD